MKQHQRRAWATLDIGPIFTGRTELPAALVGSLASTGQPAQHENSIPLKAIEVVNTNSLNWDELAYSAGQCRRCDLGESRRQVVFGTGSINPSWMIIGQAPSEADEHGGVPFAGPAGQLLDSMLAATGGTSQAPVYFANALKCRPPADREPSGTEVSSCRPYLMRQIELLAPQLVLALGRVAAESLLVQDASIDALRGRVHQLEVAGQLVPLVVSFDANHYLNFPEEKYKAWQDLCLARSVCALLGSEA